MHRAYTAADCSADRPRLLTSRLLPRPTQNLGPVSIGESSTKLGSGLSSSLVTSGPDGLWEQLHLSNKWVWVLACDSSEQQLTMLYFKLLPEMLLFLDFWEEKGFQLQIGFSSASWSVARLRWPLIGWAASSGGNGSMLDSLGSPIPNCTKLYYIWAGQGFSTKDPVNDSLFAFAHRVINQSQSNIIWNLARRDSACRCSFSKEKSHGLWLLAVTLPADQTALVQTDGGGFQDPPLLGSPFSSSPWHFRHLDTHETVWVLVRVS